MPIARLPELNWRRAFAEVALIFVGITLALLFDNWNQDRKERELELQLLSEVRDDLVETRVDLETDIRNSERRLATWRDLTAALLDDAPLDERWASEFWGTMGASVLVAKTSGYRSLTSQGLGIVSEPQVRKAITDFYELRVARIGHYETQARNYLNGSYRPFFREALGIPAAALRAAIENPDQLEPIHQFEPREPAALKRDPTTAMQISQVSSHTQAMLEQYRQTLLEIDEVIRLIDAQLTDHG
jgi:hypothetical protein